ncbi:MAG: class I SAM-dependent RNA methyltransferase, partial [Chitinophagales bacterium]
MDKETLQIEIAGVNHQGEGVGRVNGMVYFVPNTFPGDLAEIEETGKTKNYCRGTLVRLIKLSPHRLESACTANQCGGCCWQCINYEEQLVWKRRLVEDSLRRIGHVQCDVNPVIGMEDPYHYRNKATFHVERTSSGIKIGFYETGSHKIVQLEDCSIIPARWPEIIQAIQGMIDPLADDIEGITLRQSYNTGELMVIFHTHSEKARLTKVADQLMKRFPEISGVVALEPLS